MLCFFIFFNICTNSFFSNLIRVVCTPCVFWSVYLLCSSISSHKNHSTGHLSSSGDREVTHDHPLWHCPLQPRILSCLRSPCPSGSSCGWAPKPFFSPQIGCMGCSSHILAKSHNATGQGNADLHPRCDTPATHGVSCIPVTKKGSKFVETASGRADTRANDLLCESQRADARAASTALALASREPPERGDQVPARSGSE